MTEFLGYTDGASRFFGESDPAVERLRKWPSDVPYEVVEASYFGFNIPEERINCEVYYWFHPRFGIASGGTVIFSDIKRSPLSADYHDWREFMPAPADITNCTYANGVTIKMLKPLEEFEISLDDRARETSFQFRTKAIMPVAVRPTGYHFTQAMKNTGSLVLRGKPYKIDGYFTRDRTWGDTRPETRMDVAPIAWHVGVFGDDLAFHVMAFDSPELNPAAAKRYPGLEGGKNFRWGYVWNKGKLLGVKSCQKLTLREKGSFAPTEVQLVIVDEHGERYEIHGTGQARYPYSCWPNMRCYWVQTRWTYANRVGYGDTQDILYEDFVRENLCEEQA